MKLTEDQRLDYERNGYLVAPGLLAPVELEPLRRALEGLVSDIAARLLAGGQITDPCTDAPFERRLGLLYQGREPDFSIWNREIFGPAIHALGTNPAILDLAESLLGPEIQMNGDYWVRPKLPGLRSIVSPWHQDSGSYGPPTEHTHIVSLWIPLVDVDERNGCMQIIRGSHRWGLQQAKPNADGHLVPLDDPAGRGEIETLRMRAGDGVAFSQLTMHRSLPNSSDAIRWSIDLRYSAVGTPVEWLVERGYPGFIARSRSDPASEESWETWRARRVGPEQAFS
jgi:hypothetical protein